MSRVSKLVIGTLCAVLMLSLTACAGRGGVQARDNGFSGRQQADVTGEISAINGNSVTLKLLEFGGPRGSAAPGAQRSRDPNATRPSFTRDPNATRPAGDFSMARQYTGEEKTLTIPDGAKITSTVLDNGAPAQVEEKFSDLKVGDVLMITYQSDKKTVDSVSVVGDSAGGQPAGN